MCTAVTYKSKDFYFGRTLDNDFSYFEEVTITPRNYPFYFRHTEAKKEHYAIIGMAYIKDDYPLYYDAVNEKGLSMAGLNFVGNAVYKETEHNKDNIAPFEFIPWILSECATVGEAKEKLKNINLTNTSFSDDLPPSELHWIIADKGGAVTVEATKDGIFVYDNSVGVLTNNPTFDMQMFTLNNFMHLSNKAPQNKFSEKLPLEIYSRGMGALGLPGDLSSNSRFIRAAFVKENSVSKESEEESVSQFFHILGAVEQQRGCCKLDDDYEISIYTSCCNADKGIYYYKTYDNHQITGVCMHNENLDGSTLVHYPLILKGEIKMQNKKAEQ